MTKTRTTVVVAVLLAASASMAADPADTPRLVAPVKVTNSAANDQLLYFTSSSLTADDKHLVFLSDRTGNPNLFVRDLASGEERPLTDNTEGMLKSYVYFDGTPYRGLGKASVSLHAPSGTVYYIQGRQICRVDLQGHRRVLAEYPAGQMTAFTHVSADGTRLCVPTTDERALDGEKLLKGKPPYNIDQRVREEKLASYLRVYDTKTGEQLFAERIEGAWITHVQFSPVNRDLILYNHEWPSECGIRRMWLWDGKSHLRLRPEGEGRSKNDWACHEMWERDGQAILYHGGYAKGPAFLGRVRPDGTGRVEIPFPPEYKTYGHFTVGKPGMVVTDGYFCLPGGKQANAGGWITLLNVDWDKKTIQWIPLCHNDSSWRSQDAHPHPILNHASDAVYFTSDKPADPSDKTRRRAVYRAGVADVWPGTTK